MTEAGPDWGRMDGREIPSVLELFDLFRPDLPPKARVVELGCARGRIPLLLAGEGPGLVVGLDLNAEAAGLAARRAAGRPPGARPLFVAGDASAAPLASNSFDRTVIQACLTTIPDARTRAGVVNEAARLLKPGGSLYLAEYGRTDGQPHYRRRYDEGLAQGLEEGSFPVFDPESGGLLFIARHFTRAELAGLITDAGLKEGRYAAETFTTRTGNRINGHVFVAFKR